MSIFVYALCMVTSILCAGLLLRGHAQNKNRLLFWSGLYFIGASLNNLLLLLDQTIFLTSDLLTWRLLTGLAAALILLYGLVWEGR
jgi:hypothetical protein